MFIREKVNKSGSISVQILEKHGRRNHLVTTIGTTSNTIKLDELRQKARQYLLKRKGQLPLVLPSSEADQWFDAVVSSMQSIRLIGPDLLLGQIYDQVGFNQIDEPLLRQLVIARLIHPVSKLKTVRYLKDYSGQHYHVKQIYRYLDKLHSTHKSRVEQISYEHTLKILGGRISIVFYDVTTIYFEADREDELRRTGFSKEGKHQHPQILLGLLVSKNGYPLAYEIFEGNKYEGHTMLPILDQFKQKYQLTQLVIVADSGLMSGKNVQALIDRGYEFILGARIKNESHVFKEKILGLKLTDGQSKVITKSEGLRLVINYSAKRAAKDAHNRQKGLKKLENSLAKGMLTKNNINNRGYNKYLRMEGTVSLSIDYDKFKQDGQWDGLKGYLTNTKLSLNSLIHNYNELWKIEKAFRVSKTDLRVRPVFHRLKHRIEAHICIAFMAYKIYKELERQLHQKQIGITINRAIEIIKTIQQVTFKHHKSNIVKSIIFTPQSDQEKLLKAFNLNVG